MARGFFAQRQDESLSTAGNGRVSADCGLQARDQKFNDVDTARLLSFVRLRLRNIRYTWYIQPWRSPRPAHVASRHQFHQCAAPRCRCQLPALQHQINGSIGKTILILIGDTRRVNQRRGSRLSWCSKTVNNFRQEWSRMTAIIYHDSKLNKERKL